MNMQLYTVVRASRPFWLSPLAVALVASCASSKPLQENTIGPSGGVLSFDDGVTVTFPAMALSSNTAFTLEKLANAPEGALGSAYKLDPPQVSFALPALVSMPYERPSYLPPEIEEAVYGLHYADEKDRVVRTSARIEGGRLLFELPKSATFAGATNSPAQLAAQQNYPQGVASAKGYLYWTSLGTASETLQTGQGMVQRIPLAEATFAQSPRAETVARIPAPKGLAADATKVYVVSGGSGPDYLDAGILGIPHEGGAVHRVAATRSPMAVAVYGGRVYFTDGAAKTLASSPVTAGSSVFLSETGENPVAVVVDESGVYWVERGTIGTTTGTLRKIAHGGGSALTLAAGQAEPNALVLDGEYVFFVCKGNGRINRVSKAGGEVVTLRTLMRASQIAADGESLYVVDSLLSRILRLSKGDKAQGGRVLSLTLGHVTGFLAEGASLYFSVEGATKDTGSVRGISKL